MRFIMLGAGGVGGVIGGRLFQHGYEVVLIARGTHLDAIRSAGLRLEDPDASVALMVPAVDSPAEVSFGPDDVVIVATKTQDAANALQNLRIYAPSSTAIVCATNGVETERLALRLFENVYGLNVMMPTAFLEPGVVQVISAPISGGLDIGRYPLGTDERANAIAEALSKSSFSSDAQSNIMRFKYRKLVLNTANSVEAACGRLSSAAEEIAKRASAEAEAVYAAAGIDVATNDEDLPKRSLMVYRPIGGKHRGGGSTWQSVAKGGRVETDYLNGEIVLLGRLNGVPTPVNALLQRVMAEIERSNEAPGSRDADELLAELPA